MITVFYLDVSTINMETYEKFYSIVSDERKSKANKFRFFDDSKRCIFGEILLLYSLFRFLGYNAIPHIDYNSYGKPFIKNLNDFHYNISHSGQWVVCAYGNSEVGVDIEKIVYEHDNNGIINNFFSKEEKDFICLNADKITRAQRFTQIWTLKESYIKYLGTGLSTSLNSFSTNIIQGVVKNSENQIDKYAKLKSYLLGNDYYLSICSQNDEVIIKSVTISQLLNHFQSI